MTPRFAGSTGREGMVATFALIITVFSGIVAAMEAAGAEAFEPR